MEKDVKKMTKFIDNYLEAHQMEYITPPEANELLAEAGLLDDSESRSGKPLRDLLRDNKFPHAYQERRLWRIPKSNNLLVHGDQKDLPICDNKEHITSEKKKMTKTKDEKERDELYVIRLCNEVLGVEASRQHTFDFLRGDGNSGKPLPVDAYYEKYNLVIEYYENQHSESVPFFDKKNTVSGVTRGEQRRIYDERRKTVLPQHGIKVVIISYSDFGESKRIKRDYNHDIEVVRRKLNGII